jgi:hypothetical protein
MKYFATILTYAALGTMLLPGQTDQSRINGTITDASGGAIVGARVGVKSEKTGETRQVLTNEQGIYVVTALQPARYTITVEAPGFSTAEFREVTLAIGQVRTLNSVMQPASVTTEVTVSGGELAVIDTSSARVGVNVSEREVASVPLNGRQISQLYLMSPGAITAGGGSYDNIRFNGRANQQNAVRFDGVEGSSIIDSSPGNLNGETSSGFRLQASLENVQEFRVESSNYPAEYGTGTGGQISIVTKSGSNAFHGGLFEYLRNDALDARNFFDQAKKSTLRLNQFGGSIGGPIKKDKLFFFAAYEGLQQRGQAALTQTTLSDSARARAVESIRPLLAAYPKGTSPTSNPDLDVVYFAAPTVLSENSGNIRLDYRINETQSVNLRYFRDQGTSDAPYDASGSAFDATAVPQNAMINWTSIISPALVNEIKVGGNFNKTRTYGIAPQVPGLDLSAVTINATGSVALAGIGGQGARAALVIPSGLVRASSATNGRGQPYTNTSWSFIDNLNWVKGKHTAKFGGEIRLIDMYTDRLGGTTYSFASVDALLNNQPSTIAVLGDVSAPSPFNNGVTGNRHAKAQYYVGYAQDEWKLLPTLTMSYGLRWEYYKPLYEANNYNVQWNIYTGQYRDPAGSFFQSSVNNWGPRLALSWSPAKLKNKTVFRVGGGYYYGPGQMEDQIQPIESDRVSTNLPSGTRYPIDPLAVIKAFNPYDPNARVSLRAYDTGYRIPERILSYTASLQQELPWDSVLTVAYVGSQGRNLFLRSIANKIVSVGMNPTTGAAIVNRQFGNQFAEIDYKTSGGTDNYNALQTTFNRRFSKGLTSGLQWTWGRSIGCTGGSNEAQTAHNPYDLCGGDHGNNPYDVRHSLNWNALYTMPFKFENKAAQGVLGGWQIGGVLNYRTGLPIDLRTNRADVLYRDSRDGTIVTNPIVVGGRVFTEPVINTLGGGNTRNIRRPDVVAGVNPFLSNPADKRVFLNPAAFMVPQPGTFGNLGRWALHGPSLTQIDFTLQKRFMITERQSIEFRSDFYNILNHANFANPPAVFAPTVGVGGTAIQPGVPFSSTTAGSAFGVIANTVDSLVGLGSQRQIQFSLRYAF